jgi:hypothetical protein
MNGTIVRGPGAPKLISSQMTFFHKRVFPVIWFGFIGISALVTVSARQTPRGPGLVPLLPLLCMAGVGFVLMKKLVFDLVDEVWDEGSSLLIKNKGYEVRVALAEIMNISHTRFVNPPRVTLSLRHSSSLGAEISFLPPMKFIHFARSPLVDDLIRRVDAARLGARRTSE